MIQLVDPRVQEEIDEFYDVEEGPLIFQSEMHTGMSVEARLIISLGNPDVKQNFKENGVCPEI